MAAISIGLSAFNFSRHDPSCDTIQVFGAIDLAHQGQTCTITLARNDVYGILATHTLPNVGASIFTSFDLNGSEMNDSDGYNRCIQGDYTVTATLSDSSFAKLPATVTIVSVKEARSSWLFGLTQLAAEVSLPRQQPQIIPAEVTFVSPAFIKDAYNLVYSTTPVPSLSFAGGPPLIITPNSGLKDYVLLDEKQADYIQVRVNTFQLPAQSISEVLVIDQAQLSDNDFISKLRLATDYIETRLGFWVEPHLVISERLKSEFPRYEKLLDGATFYDDFNAAVGVFPNISLPFQQLIKVKQLRGFYNQQSVLTVPSPWIQEGAFQQGNIELVPTSGQASALIWQSFPFAFSAMQVRCVPAFWQYACLAGLRDLSGERGIIRELIVKKAGIDLANMISQAYKAGIASESTSRDNLSVSRSYTQSAMYNIHSSLTLPWADFIKENLPRARARFGGIPVVTVV